MLQNTDTIFQRLQDKFNSIAPIPKEDWHTILPYWKKKKYKKGNFITINGTVEPYFYYVDKGVARIYSVNEAGAEVCVGFTYNNDFAGIYDSFLAQKPSDFFIECLTDVEVLRINYQDTMYLYDACRSFERWGRIFNAEILIGMARRQAEVRSASAEDKVMQLKKRSPHIFDLVPHKHLASYLGITPETFSRMRKKIDK